jgi:hypothetical protein
MSFVQFVVRQRSGRWSIRSGDFDQWFVNRKTALKAAVELAHDSGKSGKPDAEGRRGEFKTIWRYGTDPYPP